MYQLTLLPHLYAYPCMVKVPGVRRRKNSRSSKINVMWDLKNTSKENLKIVKKTQLQIWI
jgi:hypothetical protein